MSDEEEREAIAKRRNRLIALALGGIAATTTAACSPCLTPIQDDSGTLDAGSDAAQDAGVEDASLDDGGPDASG